MDNLFRKLGYRFRELCRREREDLTLKEKWYGIFDLCCRKRGNIKYIVGTNIGQCQFCKRMFTQ